MSGIHEIEEATGGLSAPTLDEVCAQVSALDPALQEGSGTYKTAVVLLSALSVGQAVDDLADFTGYEHGFISAIGERMVRSKVWVEGDFNCKWADEKSGEVAF